MTVAQQHVVYLFLAPSRRHELWMLVVCTCTADAALSSAGPGLLLFDMVTLPSEFPVILTPSHTSSRAIRRPRAHACISQDRMTCFNCCVLSRALRGVTSHCVCRRRRAPAAKTILQEHRPTGSRLKDLAHHTAWICRCFTRIRGEAHAPDSSHPAHSSPCTSQV